MIEIWEVLEKPLTQLDDFKEALEQSRGYQEMVANQSLKLLAPAPNTEELEHEVLATKAARLPH